LRTGCQSKRKSKLKNNTMDLGDIIDKFEIEGSITETRKFGTGLINSTFKIISKEHDAPDYILQSINSEVFTNIPELTSNIQRITSHIQKKLKDTLELNRHCLTVIFTKEGAGYYKDPSGKYWRVFLLIKGSRTIEKMSSEIQAEAAGNAFASFQEMMSDLPAPALFDVLPGFHNTNLRIDNLKNSVRLNKFDRLEEVQNEVEYLLSFEAEMGKVINLGKQGRLPLRNVHQDAKLSNILFDENDEVLCVIDLDTVMSGYLCYDFGDAVRSGMNTGREDDENLDNISLDMTLFKGFANGYCQASKGFITIEEVETLVFGAKLITYEQAVRFLEDYLNGDSYYQTSKEKHNLIRTRAQIKFFEALVENYDEMYLYVKGLYSDEFISRN